MRIANPIYDVVFKYLLEDNELAKLILSTILGEEITELEFRPQERTAEIGSRHLTVYRLDFAATIRNAKGEYRQVLIEIQKAKLDTDIMRFRRYLGEHYRDPNNIRPAADGGRRQALPLVTIYFLGHSLEHTKAPVIRVSRGYYDVTTGAKIEKPEGFIESLSHDSYVIQIPQLRHERRSEVEELLQIFDQGHIPGGKLGGTDRHILEIDEQEVPARYRPILRRLQRAIVEQEVAEAMDLEDEVLEALQDMEREIERQRAEKEKERAEKEQERAEKEKERAEKEQERAEKEKALAESERQRAEKEKALAESERQRAEKEKALAEKERLWQLLKQAGLEPDPAPSEDIGG